MSRLIKNLMNGRKVVFDAGNFDDWCVYVVEANGRRKAHLDSQYFTYFKTISEKYPEDKVYNDFVTIYEATGKFIDEPTILLIDSIVETYDDSDKVLVEQWFSVIYGGMVAEENKMYAKLKKRIKRLGMHQTLKQNFPPTDAANFSRGQKWEYLDIIMTPLGF